MRTNSPSAQSIREVFRDFWPCTRGDRLRLAAGGLLGIAVLASELGTVFIFEAMAGHVLQQHHLAGFWRLAGLWLAAAAAGALAMACGSWLSGLAAERIQLRLRDAVFAHAQQLPVDYFDQRRLGDLMVRLIEDVAAIEGAVASGPVSLATSAVSIIVFAGAALVIRWDLALTAFTLAPVFWLLARGFAGPFRQAAVAERAASGSVTSAVEESLANQALIRSFNQQDAASRTLHAAGTRWLRARMAEVRLDSVYAPLVYVAETCCVLVVFGLGAWDMAGGRLSLAGLLAFTACLAYLYPPVQALGGLLLTVAPAAASAARVSEILSARPEVTERRSAIRGRLRSGGRVEFDRVTFGYPGRRPVLDGLSFSAQPGRLLAVTGPSGTGKSTIARLLLRFCDPSAGRILLDGIDIRELSLHTLRGNVTVLQQEAPLLSGTVAENIGYGRGGASDREVVAAARAADADRFIRALPQGYDTPVGERGRLLSGGQRQRIAIARAFLRDAPVLLLDEPTTGLDTASAQRVMRALSRLTAGRTAIFISHDPLVLQAAGAVIVLPGGPGTAVPAEPGDPRHRSRVTAAR